MGYLFDTNIFIRSKNEMPADVWPTFWTRIAELIRDGKINSIDKVKEEIERGNDELTKWMKDNTGKQFYIPLNEEILQKYAQLQNWAQTSIVYKESAKNDFATVADAYLVATAAANNLTIVTYETSDPYCKRRVKIPDACNVVGVRYCDLNTVLRECGVTI